MYNEQRYFPQRGVLIVNQEHTQLLCASNISVLHDPNWSSDTLIEGDVFMNGFNYRTILSRYKSKKAAMQVMNKLIAFYKENPDGVFDMKEEC